MIPVIDGGTYHFLLQTAAPDNFWKQSAFEVLRGARIQAEGGTACCWRCQFRVTWGGGEGSQGTGKAAAVHKDRSVGKAHAFSLHTQFQKQVGILAFHLFGELLRQWTLTLVGSGSSEHPGIKTFAHAKQAMPWSCSEATEQDCNLLGISGSAI